VRTPCAGYRPAPNLARSFYKRNHIEGLFLSSGIDDAGGEKVGW
jgi:predicted DNA-binding helix-hairpin-helix protein